MQNCKDDSYKSFGSYKVRKVEDVDGYKFYFDNDEWVMIRPSGTEPVLRTYAESSTTEGAFKILKEVHENNPKDITAHIRLVAAYYLSGQEVEARVEAEKIMEQDPNFSTTKRISTWPIKSKSDSDFLIDVLRKAGLPD